MHLYDSAAEIFYGRLVLLEVAGGQVLPYAFSFCLGNHLGLLELSVVVRVEVAVFWRAKLAQTSLKHFGRDVARGEVDTSN